MAVLHDMSAVTDKNSQAAAAAVVLHFRRRHLLPTLQYVLPWLSRLGYDVVTLSEAAYRCGTWLRNIHPTASNGGFCMHCKLKTGLHSAWMSSKAAAKPVLVAVCCRSNGRGPELTPAALEAHNNNLSSVSLASQGSARSLDGSAAANSMMLQPSAAYLARMAKVRFPW